MSLDAELSAKGIRLPGAVCRQLEVYVSELERWNRRINLTSLSGFELRRRLIVEPCWIGQQLQMSGAMLDVGSGNGSPGIPLFLSRDFKRVHLVEARARRAAFLRHMASLLGSDRLMVHKTRIEEIAGVKDVDWVTLQGVKPEESLLGGLRRHFDATTRVVWITAEDVEGFAAAESISVPDSNSVARIFRLDQI